MRSMTIVAGLLGLTGVALGAFGAHALKPALTERGMVNAWETAVLYHLIHAVAVWSASGRTAEGAWARRAAGWWLLGVILFSGSLYALALGGPRWLGPITPLGGTAFLIGWAVVVFGAFKQGERAP